MLLLSRPASPWPGASMHPQKTKEVLMSFKGKAAIVTGGARGIGLGIARRLAADGASIALVDLNADPLGGDMV